MGEKRRINLWQGLILEIRVFIFQW